MSGTNGDSKTERPLRSCEVFVFSEENFGGSVQRLGGPDGGVSAGFEVKSIRLGPGTGVTLAAGEGAERVTQDLTTNLASFTGSRLGEHKPTEFLTWLASDRPFRGDWAVEVDGRYLSAWPDGVLKTSAKVTDLETFHFAPLEGMRGVFAVSVRGAWQPQEFPTERAEVLTTAAFVRVAVMDEPDLGPRKFSLLTAGNRYVTYSAADDRFYEGSYDERAVFTYAVKIAADESLVGALGHMEVALFENPAYWGKTWVFHNDYLDFNNMAGLNDTVSSIQLGPLTGATIYRDVGRNKADNTAPRQDLTDCIPSLKDEQVKEDEISSLTLWEVVPPQKTGVTYTCKLSQDFHPSGGGFAEFSAYRTTLTFPDTVETVEVWATDKTTVEIDGKPYEVTEDEPASVYPNVMHRLVITTDAAGRSANGRGSLAAVGLKIRTDQMASGQRLVIYPDQEVHRRLASMQGNDLFDAAYQDEKGETHPVVKDRSDQKRKDVASAQAMISTVMSTVKYSTMAGGGLEQMIEAAALEGKSYALGFSTYRVDVRTLFVREGPGLEYEKLGYLMFNQVVQVLGFNVAGDWVHVRRLSDGLTGWSFTAYLGLIEETPLREPVRVKSLALQVREGPSTVHRNVGMLQRGEVVLALAENEKGTWKKIYLPADGLSGWCSAQYLEAAPEALSFAAPTAPTAGPVRPPTISGLTPMLRFYELSQEEAAAMLARAEFPQNGLAQGWLDGIGDFFNDIYEGVRDGVGVVITAAGNLVNILIDLGTGLVGWIVDTALKAVAVVEGIIDKIGAAIEEIIKWLRFLFNWQDILDTRDYIKKSLNAMLNFVGGDLVEMARAPVENGFGALRSAVTGQFDAVLHRIQTDEPPPSASGKSSQSDAFEAIDWILSKILGALPSGSLFDYDPPPGTDTNLRQFWSETFADVAALATTPAAGLSNAIGELLRCPDKPLRALVVLLTALRDQIINILDLGEDLLLGLITVAGYAIREVSALLNAELRIPFFSDLVDWLNKFIPLGGRVTLGFSIMDAFTLVLAIPITLSAKVVIGRAPFAGQPELALAQEADGWSLTSGWAGYATSLVSIPLDMVPEGEEKVLGPVKDILEALALAGSMVDLTANWAPKIAGARKPGTLVFDSENSEIDVLWVYLFGYDVVKVVADSANFVREYREKKTVEALKRSEPGPIVFSSIMGGLHLILVIVKCLKDQAYLEILPNSIMALPDVCAAMRLSKSMWTSVIFGIVDGAAAETALVMGYIG